MKQYHSGYYYIEGTCATQVASTTKIFPTHCNIPYLSKDDKTVLAAEELVRVLEGIFLLPTIMKTKHAKIL